jgi:hypothetical protein
MAETKIIMPDLMLWQKDVFDDYKEGRYDTYVIKARRQCGKSILAIYILIYSALNKRCTSVVIEPTIAQSRRVYKQITDCLEGSGIIKTANAMLLHIQFTNGSEILFKSAEQREALRGFTITKGGLLVIDEAAYIQDDIYAILYPVVDANGCPILVISTPLFESGEYYQLYQRGLNGGMIKSYDWSTYDTSRFLSDERLKYYRETLPPLKFRSEYLGQFISEGSYIFGDLNNSIKGYSSRPSLYAAIDWGAGNDGDYTVITFMDDEGNVTKIEKYKDVDAVEQIERLSSLINNTKTLKQVMVEMNSIGRIYYENLKRKVSINIKQFTTTNQTKRNIIEQLITAFQTDKIGIPDDKELLRELQHFAAEKTKTGYTYNGADGVHDDYVMSLAMVYDLYRKHRYNKGNNFRMI